jgi:hypothetical protein
MAFLRAKHPVRDKTLWWLLYESAARAVPAGRFVANAHGRLPRGALP